MSELSKTLGILGPFVRGLPLTVVIMSVALFLAGRYLRYATPMYDSMAKIKLADANEGAPSANLYKDFDVFANSNKILAEVELLKSNVLLTKAFASLDLGVTIFRVGSLRKTDLYGQSPIRITAAFTEPKWYSQTFTMAIRRDSLLTITIPGGKTINGQLNQILNFDGGSFFITRNEALLKERHHLAINDKYEFVVRTTESVVESIVGDLDVMAVDKDIPVLRISYRSSVPQKAADVVNGVAAAYIADGVEDRFRTADTTVDFLNKQLVDIQGRLTASEQAIEGYRNSKNIINIRQETETDLRQIADLQKQLSSVHMNVLAIDSLNRYVRRNPDFLKSAPNFEAFNDLLSTEIVKKMKQLQGDRRELLTRYTVDHEKVRLLDTQMSDLADYMKESINNTLTNLQIKHKDLNRTIQEAEAQFIGLPSREKTMTVLERNFSLDEQIYRFLHQKRTEADIARAATISFHRVITEGKVARTPISPNPTLIKVLAGFLSLLMSIVLLYGVHFLKARVNNEENIQRTSETEVAGVVPFLANAAKSTAFFRQWALHMELKQWLIPGSVVTISSFDKKEGKRTLATGLATALVNLGKTVLLVDADGSLTSFGNQDNPAYVNVPEADPQWQRPINWQPMLNEWKACFDVVLIKNAPITAEPAAVMLMASATLNLLVLDSRRTKQNRVLDTDVLASNLKLPMLAFVLNRAGYTPSLLSELIQTVRGLARRRQSVAKPTNVYA
ncbi:GNVR domain-containing protein [Fibrella aquatica]|uniref:GNVR domain-containing protein n=1 Tax=Fibrella aquatica TaxID=3242487 RepID=UPI003521761B